MDYPKPQQGEEHIHEHEFIEFAEHGKEGVVAVQKGINDAQHELYLQFKTKDAEWHQAESKKLLRKVDLHLLPLLIAMYLLNFLDRK